MGFDFEREVQETMRSSYGHHYRRMLIPVLDSLCFQSNNIVHRPVIEAIDILKANRDSRQQYYNADGIPLDGVVQNKWRDIVVEQDKDGKDRINRINYEICVLRALRKRLRTKEIWVVGADRNRNRNRNPEHDLPADFETMRNSYYDLMKIPKDAEEFIGRIQCVMQHWLATLNCVSKARAAFTLRRLNGTARATKYSGSEKGDRTALVGCRADRHYQRS